MGLSEKEKKEIFLPGATWGRKLREGEQAFKELGQEHKSQLTHRSESRVIDQVNLRASNNESFSDME